MDWRWNRILRVGKNSGPILGLCGPEFMRFWDKVGDPCTFQRPCLIVYSIRHVLFSATKSQSRLKTEKMYNCLAPMFWEARPRFFYGRLLARFTVNQLAKFAWVPFADQWSPSAKPGNEVECRLYGGCVKMTVQFQAVYGPKLTFWDDIGDPL